MSISQHPPARKVARRSNRQRRESDLGHAEPGMERWLLTYADMITLLLVLFIVLFALSKINQAKYRQFQQSLRHDKVVGNSMTHGTTATPPKGPQPLTAAQQAARLRQIEQALSKALAARGLLDDVTFTINSSGLVEGLVADSTFFMVDSADLSPLGDTIVDTSGHVLAAYPNAIDVAGYTDNQAITGGPYPDNWALSSARATTVVERLASSDGVDPTHLVAIGYGQYHPIVPNSSPADQAQNRRVNIVISPTTTAGGPK